MTAHSTTEGSTPPRSRFATVREVGAAALDLADVIGQYAALILRDLARMARESLAAETRR